VEPSPRQAAAAAADAAENADDGDAAAASLVHADVAQLVDMRLRQLEREYGEVAGAGAAHARKRRSRAGPVSCHQCRYCFVALACGSWMHPVMRIQMVSVQMGVL
jgi:hypothetical protein